MSAAPAGFWRRHAAWSLDWLLLAPPLAFALAPLLASAWLQLQAIDTLVGDWVYARIVAGNGAFPSLPALALQLLHDQALMAALDAASARLATTLAQALALLLGTGALYFIAFEASPWAATPGKRLLGLRVRGRDGARATPARIALRHFSGALSWLALNLGHAMVALRADRRALHDLIAGTQVIAEGAMPRWARAWLGAQFVLLGALLLGLLGWIAWLLWQLATL